MQTTKSLQRFIFNVVLSSVVVSAMISCTPRFDSRGNLPDPDLVANIEVGHVNKREVLEMIGSPSTVEPFLEETWYYISQKSETKAFFEAKTIQRQVLIIRFDEKGIVKEIKSIGLEKGRNIKMVDRTTPTAGKEITILQQLFGNVGRFNKAEDGDTNIPGQ
jgi:outer membrane protein assembly factor BamE (lipoprotein component of BamABCDE complex)